MPSNDHLEDLKQAYQDFRQCILSIPDHLFLVPINGWSAREVVAHLIGWNLTMIDASGAILKGQTPLYYADAWNDYRNVNATFVEKYPSRDESVLLDELAFTFARLENYLRGLEPGEFDAHNGVIHYRGGPATVTRIIQSLTGDYEYHRQEIVIWLKGKHAEQRG